ncbi:MAG: hypothetical protein HXY19_00820, partial [Thermoanaerobaculaceae bacterium]|nr:hypothetical protein [Thermoanaerobaculaceae bacterium]
MACTVACLVGSAFLAQQPALAETDAVRAVATKAPLVRPSRPGFVEVSTAAGTPAAIAEFARHLDRIILACGVVGSGQQELLALVEVPDSVDGMRLFATTLGFEFSELTPGTDVLSKGRDACPPFPVLLTAEAVTAMGCQADPSIPLAQFERRLFQTGIRHLSWSLNDYYWEGMHYWPSREGGGREFYVTGHCSDNVTPKYPPTRGVQKVRVDFDGSQMNVTRTWAVMTEGPVAKLELDFDDDGVIDIVTLSGLPGEEEGTSPLVVLSGR